MANLSQMKRQRMLAFLNGLKEKNKDDDKTLAAINEIENALNEKKYGLVWEKHEEAVDVKMKTHIPVFTEDKDKEISAAPGEKYNFLLEGDNLHSLKLLEKTNKGKIDIIYIDPPYNTENKDFIYDDTYVDNNDGFKHSKWLSFMEERLLSAEKLLSPDGFIAISIGYHEINNLMLLCRELFSNKQVVSVTVKTSGGKPRGGFNYTQEYIVFICSNDFVPAELKSTKNTYSSAYHAMTLAGFNQVTRPNQVYPIFIDKSGNYVSRGSSLKELIDKGSYVGDKKDFEYDYSIAPKGTVAVWPVTKKGDKCVWRLIGSESFENWQKGYIKISPKKPTKQNKNTFQVSYIADGIIQKIEKGEIDTYKIDNIHPTIDVKEYKTAGGTIPTIWTEKKYYTNNGSDDIREILGTKDSFPYPKPVELIKDIIARGPKDALILDFFAGSGTSAQAILELNHNDGGTRRFILCTNNENDICRQVTYQRIKKVISGYAYSGKKNNILLSKKITMNVLKNADELLNDVDDIIKKYENQYDNIKSSIKDGSIIVYGEKTYDGKVDGIPANMKYYHTDFVSKDEEFLSDALLNHIAEMIQLEHGVKLDGKEYLMVLTDEEADELASHWQDYPDLKGIYLSSNVLLTTKQEHLFKNVETYIIPDYYFDFELEEAGESW